MAIVSLPHGGFLEVVFSLDTTSSMTKLVNDLRITIRDLIQRLQADIPGIRIAVFAHGDYCDTNVYVTKWIDFTSDAAKLCHFVQNMEETYGGDVPECYELVLKQVSTELSWTPGSRRVLVMIGDSYAHEPEDACNNEWIDWRTEVKKLAQKAVTIYGVQSGCFLQAEKFYQTISTVTGGKHIQLRSVDSLFDTLVAICYRESDNTAMLTSYEKEVRVRHLVGFHAVDVDTIFENLRHDACNSLLETPAKSFITPAKSLITPAKSFIAPAKSLITPAKSMLTSAISVVTIPKRSKRVRISKNSGTISATTTKKEFSNKTTQKLQEKTSKLKQDVNQFRLSNLPRLMRENVPESNFNLRSLTWTTWKLAMINSKDLAKYTSDKWEKRPGRPGFRLKMLPLPKSVSTTDNRQMALFEAAVQCGAAHQKRYVVSKTFSTLRSGLSNWEHKFLPATSQIDRILKYGGRVYVRLCLLHTKDNVQTARCNIGRYDYLWDRVRGLRSHPRNLVRNGIVISKSS